MIEERLSVREQLERTKSRAWILQVLYRWESGAEEESLGDALSATLRTRVVAPGRRPYVERVVAAIEAHLPEIDATLEGALDNWRLARLARVDRAILRLAAAEILYLADIPPRVSIQEAVRLARKYGGQDSWAFVNGVLDALFRSVPGH